MAVLRIQNSQNQNQTLISEQNLRTSELDSQIPYSDALWAIRHSRISDQNRISVRSEFDTQIPDSDALWAVGGGKMESLRLRVSEFRTD